MRKLVFLLLVIFSANAVAAPPETVGFFPYFLTKIKNYGRLRSTINKSELSDEEKQTLLQPIALVPKSRRLPKLKFTNGVFLFSSKGHTTRVDPINPQQGLFKINGKMILLDTEKWGLSEAKIEKLLNPPDPAHAVVVTMFASWYACEKETCSNSWIGNLSSNLRAEYKNRNAGREDRRPAQK